MKDIVIDTNVARLFDAPADNRLKPLFIWLVERGYLAISQHLLNEYNRHGNRLLAVLIRDLGDKGRLNKVSNQQLRGFKNDKNYNYTCNDSDVANARTTFLSNRKILVSFDKNLRSDVNGFHKIDGIKPRAHEYPPGDVLR